MTDQELDQALRDRLRSYGAAGGRARAAALSQEQRQAQGRMAARARWARRQAHAVQPTIPVDTPPETS